MSTTYTDSLRIALQSFNSNANTWGGVINNQLTLLDKGIAGVASLDVTGSVTIDLTTSATDGSDSLSKRAVLKFTGIPTADCSVKTPAVSKVYIVHSSLTASKNIFIHPTGSNVGVTVGPSDMMIIYCDGTDMIKILGSGSLGLVAANNLSDLTNTSAALVNLGITASASELNALDGITASVTELNYTDGVTSNIQTQINAVSAQLVSVSGALGAQITSVNSALTSINAAITSLSAVITSVAASVVNTTAGRIVTGAVTTQWGPWSTSTASGTSVQTFNFGAAFSGTPYHVNVMLNTVTTDSAVRRVSYTASTATVTFTAQVSNAAGTFLAIGPT